MSKRAKLAKFVPEPTPEGFREYLCKIPRLTADGEHSNSEEWWVWDSFRDLLPFLQYFVEVKEMLNSI